MNRAARCVSAAKSTGAARRPHALIYTPLPVTAFKIKQDKYGSFILFLFTHITCTFHTKLHKNAMKIH